MIAIGEGEDVFTICENGYGKRTAIEDYRQQGRGGQGLINIRTTERNGGVVGVRPVKDDDDLMFITQNGLIVRSPAGKISRIGRATQGVRCVSFRGEDKLVACARVPQDDI